MSTARPVPPAATPRAADVSGPSCGECQRRRASVTRRCRRAGASFPGRCRWLHAPRPTSRMSIIPRNMSRTYGRGTKNAYTDSRARRRSVASSRAPSARLILPARSWSVEALLVLAAGLGTVNTVVGSGVADLPDAARPRLSPRGRQREQHDRPHPPGSISGALRLPTRTPAAQSTPVAPRCRSRRLSSAAPPAASSCSACPPRARSARWSRSWSCWRFAFLMAVQPWLSKRLPAPAVPGARTPRESARSC